MRVLIVEDNRKKAEEIINILHKKGIKNYSIETHVARVLKKQKDLYEYDLIITDLGLPRFIDSNKPIKPLEGLTMMFDLSYANINIPTIVYSTTPIQDDAKEYLKELEYPFIEQAKSITELYEILNNFLKKKEHDEEIAQGKIKVIFLDFDGVINNVFFGENERVCVEYVNRLKRIIDATGAKIVVSSANKNEFDGIVDKNHKKTLFYERYEKKLNELGIEIYDYTPYYKTDSFPNRGKEIALYLKRHPEISEYLILEDDEVIRKHMEHQVLIEYSNGIQEEHIEPSINILNGKLGFYPPDFNIFEPVEERFQRILKHNESKKD